MRRPALTLVCAQWLLMLGVAAAPLKVLYPNVDGIGSNAYGYKVLELALSKCGVPYQLSLDATPVNHERARIKIDTGEVSVFDFGTSAQFERRLLPVYFPIDRGLNGYRLFIIHRDRAADFAAINTIGQLRKMRAGQGVNWSDIAILQHAGIEVQVAPFDSLFKMIDIERFDFFPLGANEAFGFLEAHKASAPHAIVEQHIVLIYPFGRLFFVRRGNTALRDAILRGLEAAFDDGSFQALLGSHADFASTLKSARLKERVQIHIDNPFLTPEFRRIPKKYFFDIEQ
jgi:hypothetical protein